MEEVREFGAVLLPGFAVAALLGAAALTVLSVFQPIGVCV